MSVNSNADSSNKPGVGMPVVAAAVVALIALVGGVGYWALTPKVYAPPIPTNIPKGDPSKDAFNEWAKQKYQETSGAWDKLAPADRQKFMNASRGKGQSLFETFKP